MQTPQPLLPCRPRNAMNPSKSLSNAHSHRHIRDLKEKYQKARSTTNPSAKPTELAHFYSRTLPDFMLQVEKTVGLGAGGHLFGGSFSLADVTLFSTFVDYFDNKERVYTHRQLHPPPVVQEVLLGRFMDQSRPPVLYTPRKELLQWKLHLLTLPPPGITGTRDRRTRRLPQATGLARGGGSAPGGGPIPRLPPEHQVLRSKARFPALACDVRRATLAYILMITILLVCTSSLASVALSPIGRGICLPTRQPPVAWVPCVRCIFVVV